jgi:hypothetical protein
MKYYWIVVIIEIKTAVLPHVMKLTQEIVIFPDFKSV